MLAADGLGGEAWVVKAQIHAGGRGKAGGVKLAKKAPTSSRSFMSAWWSTDEPSVSR